MASSLTAPGPGRLLGRVGGMLLHPRRTLEDTLEAPGSTANAVIALAVFAALLADPMRVARGVALATVSLTGGLGLVASVIADFVLYEVVAVLLFAAVLGRFAPRSAGEGIQAASLLALMPFLALLLLGTFLGRTGLEEVLGPAARVLPHHPWRWAADPGWIALQLVVAYLPTLALLAWLTVEVRRRSRVTNNP